MLHAARIRGIGNAYKFRSGSLKGTYYFETVSIEGGIILK
jgi:hypothetical protein